MKTLMLLSFKTFLLLTSKNYSPPEVKESFKNSSEKAIFIFHVNIRSMNEQELWRS